MGFLDEEGNEISKHRSWNYEEKVINLAENEELFAVYGFKDRKDWFSTFGYIVKVRQY